MRKNNGNIAFDSSSKIGCPLEQLTASIPHIVLYTLKRQILNSGGYI